MEEGPPAYEFDLAVARIEAAVAAARSQKSPFVLCARADGVMNESYDMEEAIRRVKAFADVGADLVYVPVVPDIDSLADVVAATNKPVNALAAGAVAKLTVDRIAAIGVRRISVGSMISRLTHAVTRDVMRSIMGDGRFDMFDGAASGDEIDGMLDAGAIR